MMEETCQNAWMLGNGESNLSCLLAVMFEVLRLQT